MKTLTSLSVIVLLLGGCNSQPQIATNTSSIIEIKNANSSDRIDVPVTIKRSKVNNIVNESASFKITNSEGTEVNYQLDDLDGDGSWDEIALLLNLKANKAALLTIDTSKQATVPNRRAHARLGYSASRNDQFTTVLQHKRPGDHLPQSKPWLYQFEGPGWENDKVAFRAYFDNRNGKDIFGKTTSDMIIDTIGLPIGSEEGSYHHLLPWGMDILKVGSSLGAGGIALLTEDSLYRLENTSKASYKLVSDGPLRAIIELRYEGWEVENTSYNLTETITIWGGQYAYKSDLAISPKPKGHLTTGIVTMKLDSVPERITNDSYSAVLTFGAQSENHDELGMAIITSAEDFNKFETADSLNSTVKRTSLVVMNSDNPSYWFVAGWGLSNDKFKSYEGFMGYVSDFANETQNEIVVE